MADYWDSPEKNIAGIIPLHFNVSDHALPLRDFMATAVQIETIVNEINQELFNGRVKVEVLVLPPEPGTFLTKLAITAGAILSGAFVYLDSDMGKEFITKLTGQTPVYWNGEAGTYLKELFTEEDKEEVEKEIIQQKCMINLMLSEGTKSFLIKDHQQLRKVGITKAKMRSAYEAKNRFYEACHNNSCIKSIGFTEDDDFPIERNSFLEQVVLLPEKSKDEEEGPWTVEIVDIIVTSPNGDPTDNQRHWKARFPKGSLWTFKLDDEIFWDLIQRNKIKAAALDFMKVQLAFVEEGSRRKHNTVLRVLEINNVKISSPLEGNALFEKLGTYKENEAMQISMFDGGIPGAAT